MRGPCDNIGREQPHADVLGLVQEHRIDRPIPGRLAIRVKAWASRENVAASMSLSLPPPTLSRNADGVTIIACAVNQSRGCKLASAKYLAINIRSARARAVGEERAQ
jgi:hypothetical protein